MYQVTGAKSVLAIPMIRHGQALGVLAVWDTQSAQRFTPQDLAAADLLGGQLAAALYNARLYSRSHRRAQQMAILNSLGITSTGVLELSDLCQVIAQRLFEAFGYYGVSVFTVDSDRQEPHSWGRWPA